MEGIPAACNTDALCFLHALVISLNRAYGADKGACGQAARNAAQQKCFRTIGNRALLFADRLVSDASASLDLDAAWAEFACRGDAPPLHLVADLVDSPEVAGTCDPRALLEKRRASFIADPRNMFPAPPVGLERFSDFYAGGRCEYVKLTVRHLRCGQVCLRDSVRGGGNVFPVGKRGKERQRDVWHGSRVSDACTPPPPPRWS